MLVFLSGSGDRGQLSADSRCLVLSLLDELILLIEIFDSFVFADHLSFLHLYFGLEAAIFVTKVVIRLLELYGLFEELLMIELSEDLGRWRLGLAGNGEVLHQALFGRLVRCALHLG